MSNVPPESQVTKQPEGATAEASSNTAPRPAGAGYRVEPIGSCHVTDRYGRLVATCTTVGSARWLARIINIGVKTESLIKLVGVK